MKGTRIFELIAARLFSLTGGFRRLIVMKPSGVHDTHSSTWFPKVFRRRFQIIFPHSSPCMLVSYCLLNTMFWFFWLQVTETSSYLLKPKKKKEFIGEVTMGSIEILSNQDSETGKNPGSQCQHMLEDHLPSSSLPSLGLRFKLSEPGNLRPYDNNLTKRIKLVQLQSWAYFGPVSYDHG